MQVSGRKIKYNSSQGSACPTLPLSQRLGAAGKVALMAPLLPKQWTLASFTPSFVTPPPTHSKSNLLKNQAGPSFADSKVNVKPVQAKRHSQMRVVRAGQRPAQDQGGEAVRQFFLTRVEREETQLRREWPTGRADGLCWVSLWCSAR